MAHTQVEELSTKFRIMEGIAYRGSREIARGDLGSAAKAVARLARLAPMWQRACGRLKQYGCDGAKDPDQVRAMLAQAITVRSQPPQPPRP